MILKFLFWVNGFMDLKLIEMGNIIGGIGLGRLGI